MAKIEEVSTTRTFTLTVDEKELRIIERDIAASPHSDDTKLLSDIEGFMDVNAVEHHWEVSN